VRTVEVLTNCSSQSESQQGKRRIQVNILMQQKIITGFAAALHFQINNGAEVLLT
jgi:hypothetical protein